MNNRAASIRARLLNLAKKEGIDFQLIIIRFLHERLLYRLSVSDYSQQLILKGGAFIYAMQGLKSRPTIDVDLLGTQISNDIEVLCEVFRQICAVESEDEVVFNPESVVGELITQQDKYNGIRLYIDATFHTVRQRIQIDIGFGDMFPKSAVATIVGIGGMAGGIGSFFINKGSGMLFDYSLIEWGSKTPSYTIVFSFCAVAYLIGWTVMKVLVPKYKPIIVD